MNMKKTKVKLTTAIVENDPELEDAEAKMKEADELHKQALATYTPLFQKLAIGGMAAAYKKHEFNKAWKESIRERNFNLVCAGTMRAMEESKRETEQIMHESLHRPGGLLHG